MTREKEGGKEDRSRFGDARDGSSSPDTGCTNQYSTSVRALQEEIVEDFLPKKKRSLRLVELYEELSQMYGARQGAEQLQAKTLQNKAWRVESCGTFLEFRVAENAKKLHKGNFCKDRFCPMCNWRRSLKIFGQTSQVMNVLEIRGYRFLFLTLTVRNCPGEDFKKTVDMMFDGWRKLYNDYFRKGKDLKAVICGAFRSLETTINQKTGQFHPHFHVILAVKPEYFHKAYIKQDQWAEMWRVCCGLDYKPIVDIRTVKPKQDKKTGEMSVAGAVAEVSKYAAKDADYLGLHEDGKEVKGQLELAGFDRTYYLRILMEGLRGRRLVDMTGCFREVKSQLGLDDTENGDLVHVDGDEIREDVAYLIVRYQWRNGVYVESFERHEPTIEDKLRAIGDMGPTAEEVAAFEEAIAAEEHKRQEVRREAAENRERHQAEREEASRQCVKRLREEIEGFRLDGWDGPFP